MDSYQIIRCVLVPRGPGVRNWQFTSSGIKLLNVANITKEGEIDLSKTDRYLSIEEVEQRYKHFLVDEGDLVIASSGISFDSDGLLRTRGNFIRKEHLPLCMNTSTIRLKAKDGISDLRFLRFWLDSFEFRGQITRQVTGSAQQNFGPSHLKQTHITLPPLREQQRIAAVLAKADRLRQMRRYALQLSDTYLQAVFLQMFGDPVTNPMGLKVTELKKVCKRITDGTHQPPKWSENGYPFLFVSNVVDGELDFNTQKFISHETWKELTARCPVEIDDILYSIVGSYGNAALVRTKRPFSFQRHIAHIKPDPDKIHPEFLLGMLQSPGVKEQADRQVRGVAQKTLNLRELKEFAVFVPEYSEQVRYVELRRRYERLQAQQREAARQADHLFDTLLHRAFRAEL